MIINSGFVVALSLLTTLQYLAVASILSTEDYGFWGFLAAALTSLLWLKQVGVIDKYVQQDDPDDEVAFQKAFTLELIVTLGFMGLMLAAIPLLAFVYGMNGVVAPGLVLAAGVPALAFQAPFWIFLRRMQFVQQRVLESVGPVVSFIVTIALAVGGAGYWSLVIGLVAGNWVAAIACVVVSPYPLRLRFDRATARRYLDFSWPMFVAGISIVLMAQVPILVATDALGLAAVGAIALANLIPSYARQASDIVTQTMYPGICAVKDRTDLLLEAFTKSNRFGILWGVPVGVGMALFAAPIVEFVIGEKWEFAVGLLQIVGLATALNQFGFNWTAFYRALDRTKPIAVAHVLQAVAICAIATPMMAAWGLDGLAAGIAISTAIYALVRLYYLAQLFPVRGIVRQTLRAMVPSAAGAAAVLSMRALAGDGGLELALAELALYLAVVGGASVLAEGALVREAVGYLRKRPQARPAAA